jgi:hypothetical protein
MIMLEAYKVYEPEGKIARIYEFRGRIKRQSTIPAPEGEALNTIHEGKRRSVYVAAENLRDAMAHLSEFRPDFIPTHAYCRGTMDLPLKKL